MEIASHAHADCRSVSFLRRPGGRRRSRRRRHRSRNGRTRRLQIAPAGGRDGQQVLGRRVRACVRGGAAASISDSSARLTDSRRHGRNGGAVRTPFVPSPGLLEWLEHVASLVADAFCMSTNHQICASFACADLCRASSRSFEDTRDVGWHLAAAREAIGRAPGFARRCRPASHWRSCALRRLQARRRVRRSARGARGIALEIPAGRRGRAAYGRGPSAQDAARRADDRRRSIGCSFADGMPPPSARCAARSAAFDRRGDWIRAGDAANDARQTAARSGPGCPMRRRHSKRHIRYFQRGHAAAGPSTRRIHARPRADGSGALERTRSRRAGRPIPQRRPCAVPNRFCLPASPSRGTCSGRNAMPTHAIDPRVDHTSRRCGCTACAIGAWWRDCVSRRMPCPTRGRRLERARPMTCGVSPELESIVRSAEATVQAAARRSRGAPRFMSRRDWRPLVPRTCRCRRSSSSLCRSRASSPAERLGAARAAARHLEHVREGVIPPLLKISNQICAERTGQSRPLARESAARFQIAIPEAASPSSMVCVNLLTLSHQIDDEADALRARLQPFASTRMPSASESSRAHGGVTRLVGRCGDVGEPMAQRAINVGQPIRPERAGALGGRRGASPIPGAPHRRDGVPVDHRRPRQRGARSGVRRGCSRGVRTAGLCARRAAECAGCRGTSVRSRRRQPGHRAK